MSESFTEYEREFQAIASQLPIRINTVTTYSNDADAMSELRRIESDLTTAKGRLQDMEMEARGLSEVTRRELGSKIRGYQANLAVISTDLKSAKDKYSRSSLMAGGSAGGAGRPLDFDKSADARSRMANTTDKLKSGSDQLSQANIQLEETVGVGTEIMGELNRNRETMLRVRGNVGLVSGALDTARTILRSMSRRELRTKIALGVFAVVLVGIIIGVIVWVVKNKSQTS